MAGSPSTSLDEIHARQSVVAIFHSKPHLRADMIVLLKESRDVSRIVQRFMTMKGDAEDLIAIRDAISAWSRIQERIIQEAEHTPSTSSDAVLSKDWGVLETLISRMKGMRRLADRIAEAIDEDALRILRATNPATGGDPFLALETEDLDDMPKVDKRQPVFTIRPKCVPLFF